MSVHSNHLAIPIHLLAALGFGAACAAGSGAGLAWLMASRGMGPGAAWPFATAAVCLGSLLGGWLLALLQKSRGLVWGGAFGLACALALLGLQLAWGGAPDAAQAARVALVPLSGAGGVCAGARRAARAKKPRR